MATHLGGDVKNSCHSAQIPRLGYQYPQLPAGPPMKAESSEREAQFWALAGDLFANPAVTRSTMMGFPCLRINGGFFACVERSTGNLIVKLPAARVTELVGSGHGIPFAPNGKVFREWVALPVLDEVEWATLLAEAQGFVGS